MATSAAKDAERVRQDKRQFVKAASTLQIRDQCAKTKPVNFYKRLAEQHMVSAPFGGLECEPSHDVLGTEHDPTARLSYTVL